MKPGYLSQCSDYATDWMLNQSTISSMQRNFLYSGKSWSWGQV